MTSQRAPPCCAHPVARCSISAAGKWSFTGRPNAIVNGCFAGAPEAAARLVRFDWSSVAKEERRPGARPRPYPKLADSGRLARAQGCLLGQAIGDSLGSLVNSKALQSIARAYPAGRARTRPTTAGAGPSPANPPTTPTMALPLAPQHARSGARHDCRRTRARRLSRLVRLGTNRTSAAPPGPRWKAGRTRRAKPTARSCAHRHRRLGRGRSGGVPPRPRARIPRSRTPIPSAAMPAPPTPPPSASALRAATALPCSLPRSRHAFGDACSQPRRASAIERARAGRGRVLDFASKQGWVLVALQNASFHLLHCERISKRARARHPWQQAATPDTNAAIVGACSGAALGAIEAIPPRWVAPVLACRPLAEVDVARPADGLLARRPARDRRSACCASPDPAAAPVLPHCARLSGITRINLTQDSREFAPAAWPSPASYAY